MGEMFVDLVNAMGGDRLHFVPLTRFRRALGR